MEFKQLEYFRMSAELGSFTKAAEALFLTQPALSRSIKALEDELGHELFTRKSQKIALNQYGQIFLQYVQQSMTILESGKRAMDELEQNQAQTVMVSVSQPDLYMELLESYLLARPEVRILQPAHSGHAPEQQLLGHEVDVVISTPSINNPLIQWKPLLREDLYLLAPQGHPLLEQPMVRLSDIGPEPFIATAPGSPLRIIIDAYFQQAGFIPNITYEVNELAMIRKMVELGLGIALFPASAYLRVKKMPKDMPPTPQSHKLRAVRVTHPICEREIGVYSLRGKVFTAAAQDFYDFIGDYFTALQEDLRHLQAAL